MSGTEPIKAYKDGVYGNWNQYEIRGLEGEGILLGIELQPPFEHHLPMECKQINGVGKR